MSMPAALRTRVGARIWIGCVQFFIMQCIVASAWRTPYSNSANFISDLGAVTCGFYPPHSTNYVCSPWHSGINTSMTLQGFIFLGGALLWQPQPQSNRFVVGAARILIALAGLGSSIVGVFPEDVASLTHYLGAALHLITGNLGLIALGFAVRPDGEHLRVVRKCIFFCSILGLAATISLAYGFFAGLGIGGIERLAVYPLPIALILFGFHTLTNPNNP